MTENKDRNFDDIAEKFAQNIYGSDKGQIRQTIIWQDLEQMLAQLRSQNPDKADDKFDVLDAGGGLAQMSQQVATLGHRVHLCDLSQEMLSIAQREIERQGLTAQYQVSCQSIQSLTPAEISKADLILFHAVMEWLADPEAVLMHLIRHMKKGAMISVLFYNQHGLVLKNIRCGNIPHILNGMPHKKRFKLQPTQGLYPEDVTRWMQQAQLTPLGKSGIRCVHDYIGDQKYMGDYTAEDVLQLEQQLCRTEPYASLGRYIHLWGQK
ncbi:MAG: methyltransferase domain-containing protein [Vibrio sp.]